MRNHLLISIYLLIPLLFFSCSDNDDAIDKINLATIRKVNITDAHLLFVAEETNRTKTRTSSEEGESGKLYKQTFNGNTEEIEFRDQEGNVVPAITNYILNLSDDLILMNLGIAAEKNTPESLEEYIFFVRKSDGAVFQPDGNDGSITTTDEFTHFGKGFYKSHYQQNKGNIKSIGNVAYILTGLNEYRLWGYGTIYKIYTSGNDLKMEAISSSGMVVFNFQINKVGDVLFKYSSSESNLDLSLMSLHTGGYLNVPFLKRSDFSNVFHILSQPDYFYYLDYNSASYGKYPIYRLSNIGSIVSKDSIAIAPFSNIHEFYIIEGKSVLLSRNGYCIVFTDEDNYVIYETNLSFNSTNYKLPVYKNFIYNFLDDRIMRLNINTGEVENLYVVANFQILKLDVGREGEVFVTGYELATGEKVCFGISDSGRTDYTYLSNGKKVVQLERIN